MKQVGKFGTAAIMFAATAWLWSFVACKSDSQGSAFSPGVSEPPTADAQVDDPFPVEPRNDGGDDPTVDSGPVDCNPQLPASFQPSWKAPTKAFACSTMDLEQYVSLCLSETNTDAGGSCSSWMGDHQSCVSCIEPADGSGPIQWYRNRLYYLLNVGSCVSVVRNDTAGDGCAASFDALNDCTQAACAPCFDAPGATFAPFAACRKAAATGACASYRTANQQKCSDVKSVDGGAPECFASGASLTTSDIVRIIGKICGS